jgi:hypothetical protein
MSWEDCIAEIRAAAGEDIKLSDRDIEKLLDKVMREARRRSAIGAPTSDTLRLAAADLAARERITALIEKRNARLNLIARIGLRERVGAAPNLADGFRAEIHGINTPTAAGGGRFSARAEWRQWERRWIDGLTRDLDREGLWNAARGRDLERQWAKELFELSKGKDGKPGITGSPEALGVAQIVHKYMTEARAEVNKTGGWIGDYSGYIARTTHDPDKIRRAGLAEWKDSIRGRLDERTFDYIGDRPEARDRFLDNVYHALVTGVHLTHEGMQGFKDPAFTGPANLARRASEARVLHFKDADSWLDYHEQFGSSPSVLESIRTALSRLAQAAALMRRFGTNPRAEFEAHLRYFMEDRRNSDPDAVTALRQAEGDLKNRFDWLDGTAQIPVNRMVARIASGVRNVMSMGHLGGVFLTHLSAGATTAAELRYQGAGMLERYTAFLAPLKNLGRERSETSDLLLAGLEGAQRDLFSHWSLDDGAPGTMARLSNLFFRWSGLTWWMNGVRRGGEEFMAHLLGRQLDRPHAEILPETQRLLSLYGIGAKEWELLRQVPDHASADDRVYLTPDSAQRIPALQAIQHLYDIGKVDRRMVDATTQRAIDAFRNDLAMRLYALYDDRSRNFVILPDIASRADVMRGTRPGTIEGELLRFFAQFKLWPAAMIRDSWGREIYGGQSRPAAIAGIVQMAAYGTVLGYAIMSLKDLAKGRNPRDPLSPKTWGAAMMQGGGMGIFGDFLFGEFDRFGHNFFETAAGPAASETLGTAVQIWNMLKKDAEAGKTPSDIPPALFQRALANTPFINLFYTRLALDYLFLWQVQEAMNPGFLRRFEKRIRDQNHQTMWLSPSQTVESHSVPRPHAAHPAPWSWAP